MIVNIENMRNSISAIIIKKTKFAQSRYLIVQKRYQAFFYRQSEKMQLSLEKLQNMFSYYLIFLRMICYC